MPSLALHPELFPPVWAQAYGQDNFGLWTGIYIDALEVRFRWIPPGEFMMGSPKDEKGRWSAEGPVHNVQIASGYWMAETACTQSVWTAIMGENPSHFSDAPENPVENVSWFDCQRFCERLNKANNDLLAHLPTEAQWEYACRAGTQTPFSFGKELTLEHANYNGKWTYDEKDNDVKEKSLRRTVDVKSYKRNQWGLYQMHGNVWEWCEDDWHDNHEGATKDGSTWIDDGSGAGKDDKRKVVRGGAWASRGRYLRSAYRDPLDAAVARLSLGFRVSLGQPAPKQAKADLENRR